MKNSILIYLLLISSLTISQQNEFSDVKTAKDVINNYLLAVGGKDKLKKINIIKLEGKYIHLGIEYDLTRYIGKDFYYQKWGNNDMTVVTVYNDKDNYGWEKLNGDFIDFSEETLDFYKSNAVNYWGAYLESKSLGITFKLNWKEPFGDGEVYAVEIIKDSRTIKTVYFDTKTYYPLKYSRDGNEMIFSDFKEVGDSGIILHHMLTSGDTLKINHYEFDPAFDKNLLKKSYN